MVFAADEQDRDRVQVFGCFIIHEAEHGGLLPLENRRLVRSASNSLGAALNENSGRSSGRKRHDEREVLPLIQRYKKRIQVKGMEGRAEHKKGDRKSKQAAKNRSAEPWELECVTRPTRFQSKGRDLFGFDPRDDLCLVSGSPSPAVIGGKPIMKAAPKRTETTSRHVPSRLGTGRSFTLFLNRKSCD